jgi:formamidopyrimidine-DNA glycosylase
MTGSFRYEPASHERAVLELDDGKRIAYRDLRRFGTWVVLVFLAELAVLGLATLGSVVYLRARELDLEARELALREREAAQRG